VRLPDSMRLVLPMHVIEKMLKAWEPGSKLPRRRCFALWNPDFRICGFAGESLPPGRHCVADTPPSAGRPSQRPP